MKTEDTFVVEIYGVVLVQVDGQIEALYGLFKLRKLHKCVA